MPAESGSATLPEASPSLFQRSTDFFFHITTLMNSAGTLWVFGIMFMILADIFAREAFDAPIRGVAELVAYSIVGAVFLQLANTLHVGRFTRAEILIDSLDVKRPVAAALFHSMFYVLGILVFALIVYGTFFKFTEAWPDLKFGVEDDFTILVWPLRLIVLIGAAAVIVEYLFQLVGSVTRFFRELALRRAAADKQPIGWLHIVMAAAAIAVIALVADSGFGKVEIGALSLVAMLALIYFGIHIGVALITLGFVGIWIMMGNPNIGVSVVKLAANEFLRNYIFGVVPLFVLMGLVVAESDIGKDTFNVARWILRPIKGGIGVATVVGNALFAAITGSSIASAAVFTKVAAPYMIDHGYTPRFAVGAVAGSSVLGMLIPPSLLLIIYGFVAEQSVGLLFLAAVVPGLILATAMGLAIIGMAHFWPSFVGVPNVDEKSDENVISASFKLLPILILITLVLGGIYAGFFTPVEAGAVGAAGALIIAVVKRRLTWRKLWKVLIETGHVTVAILFLILAANIYGRMLALSGLPQEMGTLIAGADLGFYGFMALYVLLLLVLGMFLESISIMLIVLPLVLPIVESFGADLVWFGIVTVISVEMGLLTPPLGIAVYVVRSTLDDERVTLNEIFIGAFPFVIIMLLVTILLTLFPELSLLLL
jgi:tripartite ATP-independent transporter DctM subunit